MTKTKFRAPVEHSLLLACFILVWLGPVLKLAGVLSCSWLLAFLVFHVIWIVAVLVFLAEALVGVSDLVRVEPEQAYAD
jgi:hypothetical protein